jgi:hypothetical protein
MSDLGHGKMITKYPLLMWVLILLPLGLYGAAFLGLKAQRRAEVNAAAIKSKKAFRQFKRRCARGGISASELIDAVRKFLNDRLGLSLGLLTSQEIYGLLRENGVSKETAGEMEGMIRDLEDTVYMGRGQEEFRMVEDIKQIIRRIDREIS